MKSYFSTRLLYLSLSALFCHLGAALPGGMHAFAPRSTANDWASVPTSVRLQWTPCFSNFTCTKLEVPLDYGDYSRGKTSIAIVKYAAHNQTADTQNVVLNIGKSLGSLWYTPAGNLFGPQTICPRSSVRAIVRFPALADILSGLETGNTTNYLIAVTDGSIPADSCNNGTAGSTVDSNTPIKCVDGYGSKKYSTIDEYNAYVETLTYESGFFGDVWPNNANTVACRSFSVEPPEMGKLPGSILDTKNTSFPLLFITAELDPVTPKRNAYKMSSVFPGSVVLKQNSVGHTATASASTCLVERIQAYLGGSAPTSQHNMPIRYNPIPRTWISDPPINVRGSRAMIVVLRLHLQVLNMS